MVWCHTSLVVRLQKRFAYTYNDKRHYKHIITVPDEYVDKLGWKEGSNIELKVYKDELVLKSSKKEKS